LNITRLAIEKSRVTISFMMIIILGGLFAYQRLPRAFDPGFTIRVAQVVTFFPGAAPDRVEQLVTDKLEKAIQEIPELDFVRSQSKTGVSIIFVEIQHRYDNMRPIWDTLRRKIAAVKSQLPDGVIGPKINDEFGDVFGIVIGLTGEGFSYAELKDVADEVKDELLLLDNVGKVEMYGVQEERVFIEYNNARLSEIGISPYLLMQLLESRNIIIPGGAIKIGTERIVLEPSGNFDSIQDLKKTVISIPGSYETVFLEDIVTVRRGYIDPPRTKMRATGIPCIGLAASMSDEGNLIDLGEQVTDLLSQVRAQYPIGIEFETLNFLPHEVSKKVDAFRNNLMESVLVVAAVMLITLGIRTGLIVASLIPMVIFMSMTVMYFFGIGIDQVSLAALILALGMLVDNGIVMSESIMVCMAEGKSPIEAAAESCRQLLVPLLTSSLTTAASFLPIALAESNSGEYCTPLFKVVTITLLSSWILSLTVIPLISVKFIKTKKRTAPDFSSLFYRGYRLFLVTALKYRYVFVILIIAAFMGAGIAAKALPKIFFPPSSRAYFKAELRFPPGISIEANEASVIKIEKYIQKELSVDEERRQGVTSWSCFVGNGGPRYILQHRPEVDAPDYSLMCINVTSLGVIEKTMASLENFINTSMPDVTAKIYRIENGPPIKHPVEVLISGRDSDVLYPIVQQVKDNIRNMAGTKNISDNWGQKIKKLVVKIDQPRARRAGVTSQDIAISLQTGLSGFEMTQYREDDEIIPVTLRSLAADREDIGKIESLNVYVQATGKSVPLIQVADVQVKWQPGKIFRRNRLKTVTISADLMSGRTADSITSSLIPWLKAQQQSWGIGYRYSLKGEYDTSHKANKSIMEKLHVGAFIILMLLVIQFNSLRKTLIVLLTIPLGFIGVVIGLFAADLYFGFMTLLGIIALSGIVINNSIVLIERIDYEIATTGLTPFAAVVEAAQRRCRPILLTTVTTAFGMAPLYLSGEMWKPLTMALISGLVFATILTLGFVPVVYTIFFRIKVMDS